MNRISLLFAVLMATSYFLSSPSSGGLPEESAAALTANKHIQATPSQLKNGLQHTPAAVSDEAESFVKNFFAKVRIEPDAKQQVHFDVLFATVPDPIETHLAAAFDHNLAAIQDGIQEAGYLFDSAWIPWEPSRAYDGLADSVIAARMRDTERSLPGILLFRRNLQIPQKVDHHDLVVFLLAEKPTAGIAIPQVEKAIAIMQDLKYCFQHEIRILGPNFSGSLPSLAPMLSRLATAYGNRNRGRIQAVIRSGSFTENDAAEELLKELYEQDHSKQISRLAVDLGSANHPYKDWLDIAISHLCTLGIDHRSIAVLSEDESLFGGAGTYNDSDLCKEQEKTAQGDTPPWALRISFPRDISALRASYEEQGLLERNDASTEIKRYLHLKGEDDKEGDSVREFGGQGTVASKDSVLFGISNFIRSHGVHAVIIVATNEEDRYFLSKFIHANNDGVRVVILGSTRLFMRGSTAQFRGDLMISDFPMLSRAYDWTSPLAANMALNSPPVPPGARIFPDDYSEGNYMAALDLLRWQTDSGIPVQYPSPPGYSPPPWVDRSTDWRLRIVPPMYLSAMGGDGAWPVWEETGVTPYAKPPELGRQAYLAMPFQFGQHFEDEHVPKEFEPGQSQLLSTGHLWTILGWFLWGLNGVLALSMLYANPMLRRKFAYLQPVPDWRYWFFAIAVPSFASGCSFLVLAWAHRFPDVAMRTNARGDFAWALWSAVLASWLPIAVALLKMRLDSRSAGGLAQGAIKLLRRGIGCIPAVVITGTAIWFCLWHQGRVFSTGKILNIYREMYWESGLSLVPSALLLLLGFCVWGYFSAAGRAVLGQSPILPQFKNNDRISTGRGEEILSAAWPLPAKGAASYWLIVLVCFVVALVIGLEWPSIKDLTTLEAVRWTDCMKLAGLAVLTCFIIDLVQFAWLWEGLRDLLEALDREPLRRSFVPLREFSWNSLWQFSGGSFQDRRNLLAAQYECLGSLVKEHPQWDAVDDWRDISIARGLVSRVRDKYMKLRFGASFAEYSSDMRRVTLAFAKVGSLFSNRYCQFCGLLERLQHPEVRRGVVVNCSDASKDRFKEEEQEAETLPLEERYIERFLCLLYVGFIQSIIVRLRGLAFSFVSLLFVLSLSVAIYPFQPLQILLTAGFALFVAMAIIVTVVYSQMDRDPVLSRILNSDPSKLEKSFYGKLIETLTPPLLPLLAQLLPGGGGRLIDAVSKLLSHGQ